MSLNQNKEAIFKCGAADTDGGGKLKGRDGGEKSLRKREDLDNKMSESKKTNKQK